MAAEIARAAFERGDDRKMAAMRDQLEIALRHIEATGTNGEAAPRVPNTANIYFDYIEGEALVIALDLKGWQSQPAPRAPPVPSSPPTFSQPWACAPIAPEPASASAWASKTRRTT